jgi:aspartate aminotransferase-like enzyme
MNSVINLTTGPVQISKKVAAAFSEPAISHRSAEFLQLYRATIEILCMAFQTKYVHILSGSGTLANEAMLQEIKHIGGKGLILSNGEFGNRLIDQANRNGLVFTPVAIEWGLHLNLAELEQIVSEQMPQWVLFCHCETSTGVINDLDKITAITQKYGCMCFVDCMSTIGTTPLDLSKVSMASASSGKGLASIPGLALVFSNRETEVKPHVPIYLDLGYYQWKEGIPFTISSNLVKALHASLSIKLRSIQYELTQEFGFQIYDALERHSAVPFSNARSKVFTLVLNEPATVIDHMKAQGLLLSYESEYLKRRNWYQLAIFGHYTKEEMKKVVSAIL